MNNKHSIKKTLFIIYLLIIFSMLIGNLFPYISYERYNSVLNDVSERVYDIKDLIETNAKIDVALSNFVFSGDRIYIDQIYNNYQDLIINSNKYKEIVFDEKSYLYLENVENILDNEYSEKLESTIWSVRGVDEEAKQVNYYQFKKVNQYVNIYLQMLFDRELENSRLVKTQLKEVSDEMTARIAIFMFSNLIFILFLGLSYGRRLSNNLKKLTDAAEEVSHGNFQIEKINLDSDDETLILAEAFNKLISNTKSLIHKIKDNANLEVKLHKEEAEKSQMEVLLNQAKLKGLQAQINPHFLFNTLNVIAKTAIIEDADDTCELIENVSDMLRYNLNNIDRIITVNEEINNIENYISIQKARFGERVEFLIDIDSKFLNYHLPLLTLQPIIENAFMHGVEDLENGGKIHVYSTHIEKKDYLVIEDNGVGMRQEKAESLLLEESTTSHSTGIGLNNVRKRLEFYYNREDVMFIKSEVGHGTQVFIQMIDSIEVENV